MTTAERKLINTLEKSWEQPHQTYIEPLQAIEKATADAVAADPDSVLKDLVRQEQYRWSGVAYAAPMNEAKAKQLAAEVRMKVVNPKIDLTNVLEHKHRLKDQAAALPEHEREHLLRALETLCRVLNFTAVRGGAREAAVHQQLLQAQQQQQLQVPGQRGGQKSVEVRMRVDGQGGGGAQFLAGSSGSGGSHPHSSGIAGVSPPGANANSVNTVDTNPAGTSPTSEGFETESLTKDIYYLTDTDSIPMHVHRYFTRTDRWSRTALHWAVLRCNLGIVYFLVVLGSSIHIHDRKSKRRKDILGFTPLQYAERLAANGNPAALSAIREAEDLKTTRRNRVWSLPTWPYGGGAHEVGRTGRGSSDQP